MTQYDMIQCSDLLRLKALNLVFVILSCSTLTFNTGHCLDGQNSMQKLPILPSGVQPALESLHGWGVINLRWQWVPAVYNS